MKVRIEGIGIVEVPDEFGDLTYDQQQNYIAQIKDQIESERQSPADTDIEETAEDLSLLEKLQGGARAFAQGLTFGFADEIEAGLRTGGGVFGDYNKTVQNIRDDIDELRKQSAGLAYGAEIGGALLPSLAAGLFSGGTGTVAGLGTTGLELQAQRIKQPKQLKLRLELKKHNKQSK